jgi:hypothetical protein
MKFNISLAIFKLPSGATYVNPYWFTTDRKLHMSTSTAKTMEVDSDELSLRSLAEIHAAVKRGLITSSISEDKIYELLQARQLQNAQANAQETAETEPKSQSEVKEKQIENEAVAFMEQSYNDIKKAVEIEDDVALLEAVKKLEEAGKGRKSLLKAIDERIEALKAEAIKIKEEQILEEIEEVEDDKKIVYDPETETMYDLPEDKEETD